MNFGALKTRCASRFRDEAFEVVTAAEWGQFLNDAYAEVNGASPYWPWLEAELPATVTIAANGRSVALPSGTSRLTVVRENTTKDVLTALDGQTLHMELSGDDNWTGTPRFYRIHAGLLSVWPRPEASTTFYVEYPVAPAEMSSDSDLPAFEPQHHRVLVALALKQAYEDDGSVEQATVHGNRAASILSSMVTYYLGAPRQERPYAPVDDWFD